MSARTFEERVRFPDEEGVRPARTPEERELLRRLTEFGEKARKEYAVERIEWWTGDPPDAALYFKGTMADGVYFQASISPLMLGELLTGEPLDDFFDHMDRELLLRVDEWKRGLHTPQPPDVTEHVIGFREWAVDWDKMTLGPIGIGGAPWPGVIWQKAECRAQGRFGGAPYGHSAPHPQCHCGLYALHEDRFPAVAPPASVNDDRPSRVWGVVQAKGRMEVHSNGFRAEYARPVMLASPGVSEWFVPNDPTDASKGGTVMPTEERDEVDAERREASSPIKNKADDSVRALAMSLGLDVVSWPYVVTKANEYGQTIPKQLRPE